MGQVAGSTGWAEEAGWAGEEEPVMGSDGTV